MDVSRDSEVDDPAAALAARAQEATRELYHGSIDRPAEVCQVLSSLKLLADDLARSLPELSLWLEQRMWSGNLGDAEFASLIKSVFEATTALARAQAVTAQLGQELGAAESAARELAA
jgi:hypothetical protein